MTARVALVAALLLAGQAGAHGRSVSYSSWELDDSGARVILRLSQLELTRLPWGPQRGSWVDPGLAEYVTSRLVLYSGGEACVAEQPPRALATDVGRAAFEWRVACARAGPREIRSGFMLEPAPGHLHFARLRGVGGVTLERVLTSAEPVWRLEPRGSPARGHSFLGYVWLGIAHIGTGWDHLAFVLALILIARRVGEVATVVTGFTAAHSLTLALAVLGLVVPQPGAIEALIGLSIALVAAENGWLLSGRSRVVPLGAGLAIGASVLVAGLGIGSVGVLTLLGIALFCTCYFGLLERTERPARLRVALAFAFGLVHGFGFAGVLAELDLPTHRLAPALFGFNVGVELGQLAAVALLWPLLRALARFGLVAETASAAVCGLGLFWFATRAYG